jgi:hypothetical protein
VIVIGTEIVQTLGDVVCGMRRERRNKAANITDIRGCSKKFKPKTMRAKLEPFLAPPPIYLKKSTLILVNGRTRSGENRYLIFLKNRKNTGKNLL